jgi:uncharacterized protein YdaU (DUF1376 family)
MYWSDFKADTEHLGALETGAYMMLIGHYWNTGGLPDDDIKLARIARMTAEEWAVSKSTIAEFFQDGWKHKRIEQELSDAKAAYERRANAGRRGGQAKAEASSNAVAMLKQPQPQLHISSNEDINITSTSKAYDGFAVASQSKRYDDQLLRTTAEAWNDLASSVGLATVAKLTDARKVAITRRAKELVDDFDYENPTAGFSELFSKIRGSPFLRGSESSWRCDFDWCFALSNFTKIMEGKYENRPQKVVSFRR